MIPQQAIERYAAYHGVTELRARQILKDRETLQRRKPFDPATYSWMAPHYARRAAEDERRIDAAMRTQRPDLKEI